MQMTSGMTKRMMRFFVLMGVLLVASSLKHNLNLTFAQTFPGPISTALGGAGVAGYSSPEAALLNPASLTLQSSTEVDLIYQDGSSVSNNHKTGLGLIISDNSEDVLFPGALYYNRGRRLVNGQAAEEQLWGAFLGKTFSEYLSFGLNLTYLTTEISGGEQHKQITGGLGAVLKLSEQLSFGWSYNNLMNPKNEIPFAYRLNPEMRLGARYKPIELFSFLLDVSQVQMDNPDNKGAIHAGLESFFNAYSAMRLGMKWDDYIGENFFTFGLGFEGPRLRASYSLQKALKGADGALHGVDFRVSF